MSNEYLPHDPDYRPAVGAPVQRGVRPRALLLAHTDGRETLHPIAEYAVAYRDTAVSEALLYDQAAFDAAMAAERERYAELLSAYHEVCADAALATEKERERCASIVDVPAGIDAWEVIGGEEAMTMLRELAARIRGA